MTREKIIAWIKAAGVRALKTVAQTAAAPIGTAAGSCGVLPAVLLPLWRGF